LNLSDLTPTSADDAADCLEGYVLSSSSNAVGLGALQRFAQDGLRLGDADFTFAISRMRNRRQILEDKYPFRFDVGSIVRSGDATVSPYTQFLILSNTGIVQFDTSDFSMASPEQRFEELALDAFRIWFGENSIGVRFGWPSNLGRPAEFPAAIRWLADKMDVELGTSYRPPIRKDGGVDLVVWRPFGDFRSGFLIVLVQCTIQKDLLIKARDIDLSNWTSWLALDRPPLTALATPRVVGEASDRWNQLSRQTLVFERVRLCLALPGVVDSERHSHILKATSHALMSARERLDN
jgi:hypothetical protein